MPLLEDALNTILANKRLKKEYLNYLERISVAGRIGTSTRGMSVADITYLIETAPPGGARTLMPKITPAAQENFSKFGMPVISIKNNKSDYLPDTSTHWKDLLEACPNLEKSIRAVGCIRVLKPDSSSKTLPMGTAWFVRSDVLVTNRHVAVEFANNFNPFNFKVESGSGRLRGASIDLLMEKESNLKREFTIKDVIYMDSPGEALDLAFLKIDNEDNNSAPIAFDIETQSGDAAVIGYPLNKSGVSRQLALQFFGNSYGFKRLACGTVLAFEENEIQHSCPTLNGNSGSPLISLTTGNVIGIHCSGETLGANYALPAARIKEVLDGIPV
jgi:endonuclease G, mitochondrial